MAVELLEGCVDAADATGVHWGTRSVFVTALSHFSELEVELEVLGSRLHVDLTEDQAGALRIQACPASNSLVSHVLPLVARATPDGMGE
jgi:hypothetical protein